MWRRLCHAHRRAPGLADKLKSPIGYAFRGKEWVAYENPYAVGMSGLLGWGAAYKAMHECDALLLLGTDFPYDDFMPTELVAKWIFVRNVSVVDRSLTWVCAGNVLIRETIQALLPLVEPEPIGRS